MEIAPLKWRVWHAYSTESGWIAPAEGDVSFKVLSEPVQVLNAFLRVGRAQSVGDGGVSALENYVKNFGLLGQSTCAGRPVPAPVVGRPHRNGVLDADNINWAFSHAFMVNVVAQLIRTLEYRKSRRRNELLHLLAERRASGLLHLSTPEETQTYPIDLRSAKKDAKLAWDVISTAVNPNIQGVNRIVDGAHTKLTFRAPIQMIYWALADQTDGMTMQQCAQLWAAIRKGSSPREVLSPR